MWERGGFLQPQYGLRAYAIAFVRTLASRLHQLNAEVGVRGAFQLSARTALSGSFSYQGESLARQSYPSSLRVGK
jgi:hypothetical protein